MRMSRFFTIFCLLLLVLTYSATAQRNRRPVPRPTPTPAKPYINPVISVAKMQVENQLFNINLFVDRLGPIAVIIENADKEAAAGRLKSELKTANETNKQKTIAAIRAMRDPLVALETDFRTKSVLTQYLPKIQGISTLFAQAEDQAIAGQFVAAKDPLRQVALRLNDTLAVLPGPAIGGASSSVPNRPVQSNSSGRNPSSSTVTRPVTNSKREPAIGMTTAEVLQSAWGAPNAKRNSTANTEVWMYSGNRSLYFFKGKLTNIVKN